MAQPLPYGLSLTSATASVVRVGAHDGEDRAEDLVVVDPHAGLRTVDERGAEEEAVAVERTLAAVDDNARPFAHRAVEVGRDAVAVLARDRRPHLRLGILPGPMRDCRQPRAIASTSRSPTSPTATTTEIAMHRSPAEPYAARHRGVGGRVDVGIGQHDHVVLGAAQRLHPLAVRGAGLVDVARHRCGTDEAHRGDVGVFEDPVDCDRVALHDVEHTVGQAGLGEGARRAATTTDGSFSLGFSTKVLPHAIAVASIHSGTIAGKLNGVMPATTPSGWRIDWTSTSVEACSENRPCSSAGIPHANSTFSSPAGHLARRVAAHLAVFGREYGRDLGPVLVEQVTETEEHLAAPRERRRAATPGTHRRPRAHGVVDFCRARESDLGLLLARRGVVHGRSPARARRDQLAVDPVVDALGHWRNSLWPRGR